MIKAEPALEFREEQPCVAIAIPVPIKEWSPANARVPEVLNWMSQHGIAPAGPLFYRYRAMGGMDESSDLEIGFPPLREEAAPRVESVQRFIAGRRGDSDLGQLR